MFKDEPHFRVHYNSAVCRALNLSAHPFFIS